MRNVCEGVITLKRVNHSFFKKFFTNFETILQEQFNLKEKETEKYPYIDQFYLKNIQKSYYKKMSFKEGMMNDLNSPTTLQVSDQLLSSLERFTHDEYFKIPEGEMEVYEKVNTFHHKKWTFDNRLFYIFENHKIMAPFAFKDHQKPNLKLKDLKSSCKAISVMAVIYRKMLNNKLKLAENTFRDTYVDFGRDQYKQPDRFMVKACNQILKNMSKILEKNISSNKVREQVFMADLIFSLLTLAENQGEVEAEPEEHRFASTHEKLQDILKRNSAMKISKDELSVPLSERFKSAHESQSIGEKKAVLVHLSKIAAFVWWNFEWKIFWKEWQIEESYDTYFGALSCDLRSVMYKTLLIKVSENIKEIFDSFLGLDTSKIQKYYENMELMLKIVIKYSLDQEKPLKTIESKKLSQEALKSGNFDFAFPLNLNIVEYGILSGEGNSKKSLIFGQVGGWSDLVATFNLDFSTVDFLSFRVQWFKNFKKHLLKYSTSTTSLTTLKAIQNFSDQSFKLSKQHFKKSKIQDSGTMVANMVLTNQLFCDLNQVLITSRFFTMDKKLVMGVLDCANSLRFSQVQYFQGSPSVDIVDFFTRFSQLLGNNKWYRVRQTILGLDLPNPNSIEKSTQILDSISHETLPRLISDIIYSTDDFREELIPVFNASKQNFDDSSLTSTEIRKCVYSFYKGIVKEFVSTLKKAFELGQVSSPQTNTDPNSDIMKQLPALLGELYRLELYEKKVDVSQNEIETILKATIKAWIDTFQADFLSTMQRSYTSDDLVSIQGEFHSEGAVDYISLITSYINLLSDMMEDDIVKEKLGQEVLTIVNTALFEYLSYQKDQLSDVNLPPFRSLKNVNALEIQEVSFPKEIEHPKQSTLKSFVKGLESKALRLGNMMYVISSIELDKDTFLSVISERCIQKLQEYTKKSDKLMQQKLAVIAYSTFLKNITLKNLYYDYGSKRNYSSIRSSSADINQIFGMFGSLIPPGARKEFVSELMKFSLNHFAFKIARLIQLKYVRTFNGEIREIFMTDLKIFQEACSKHLDQRLVHNEHYNLVFSFIDLMKQSDRDLKKCNQSIPVVALMMDLRNLSSNVYDEYRKQKKEKKKWYNF